MYYKDVTSNSLFLKDLAKKSPKFLIPKDRTKGGLRDGLPNWSDCPRTKSQEPRAKSQELRAWEQAFSPNKLTAAPTYGLLAGNRGWLTAVALARRTTNYRSEE